MVIFFAAYCRSDRTDVEKVDQLLHRLDLLARGSQDDNIDKISMQFYEDYYVDMFDVVK